MSKRRTNTKRNIVNISSFQQPMNAIVSYDLPKKKFTIHDLEDVSPLTYSQKRVFELWEDNCSMVLSGSAGTGKTFLAIYLALQEILSGKSEYKKLIIVRSAVEVRTQGFLPGTLEEKQEAYEAPYDNIFDDIFKRRNQYKTAKDSGIVEFVTSSYMRGVTMDDAIIVCDEIQNFNYAECSTLMTRVGRNAKIVLCGDTRQSDLVYKKNDVSGFPKLLEITKMMPDFRNVHFTMEDCVRSGFVKSFMIAEERFESLEIQRENARKAFDKE